jgi:tRNA uridine 5-carbamoylmethylation protein Kti12
VNRKKAYHEEELLIKLTPAQLDTILEWELTYRGEWGCTDEEVVDKLIEAYEDWEYDYKK